MLLTKKQLEKREGTTLAPYAMRNTESKGRKHKEAEDNFRLPFQRDRDRIIHSRAFRRLHGKTQVFRAYTGDHFRSRLTHSLEVSQISRDIARNINLNEDLAEAIALAHDLGHTPFGHAGEEALDECMQQFGEHFEHNRQSRRVVEFLEKKYEHFDGLNLTFEVLDGLIKHRSAYDKGELGTPSIEALVVNVADSIAYNAHDIDDGLRGEIFTIDQCRELCIWKRIEDKLTTIKDNELIRHRAISELIKLLVTNLYETAEKNFKEKNYQIVFSEDLMSDIEELQAFLSKNFYYNTSVHKKAEEGQNIIKALFHTLNKKPELLPKEIQTHLENEERHIVIKDYIAGMTDTFASDLAEKLN